MKKLLLPLLVTTFIFCGCIPLNTSKTSSLEEGTTSIEDLFSLSSTCGKYGTPQSVTVKSRITGNSIKAKSYESFGATLMSGDWTMCSNSFIDKLKGYGFSCAPDNSLIYSTNSSDTTSDVPPVPERPYSADKKGLDFSFDEITTPVNLDASTSSYSVVRVALYSKNSSSVSQEYDSAFTTKININDVKKLIIAGRIIYPEASKGSSSISFDENYPLEFYECSNILNYSNNTNNNTNDTTNNTTSSEDSLN